MKEDFLHQIDLDALKKEVGMNVDEIGALAKLKNSNGVYKWAKTSDNDGTRPSFNAIVRLLRAGATTKTLFGVDYAATHQPAPEPAENREPIDYQDPKFLAALEKGMALIEARKKQGTL